MKTQQPNCMHTTYKVSIRCISLCFHKIFISIWYWKVLPGRSVLHYTMLPLLASKSLLLNMADGYQSLSSLFSKRFLWN